MFLELFSTNKMIIVNIIINYAVRRRLVARHQGAKQRIVLVLSVCVCVCVCESVRTITNKRLIGAPKSD